MKIKFTNSHLKALRCVALATSICIVSIACSFQQYVPKAIDSASISKHFERKSPADESFHQYLASNGYSISHFPVQQWGLDELTYCALFFHPSLDVARAQWRAAELSEVTFAEKPISIINTHLARSNNANKDISPYSLGLSIDISIDTANKRDIRIESARHLSQAAKLEIAQTAWKLRNEVAQSFYDHQLNQQLIKILIDEKGLREKIVNLYQKRVDLGTESNVALSAAKLKLQTTNAELNTQQQAQLSTLSKLASNLGLPLSKTESLNLSHDDSALQPRNIVPTDTQLNDNKPSNIQAAALLNRLDIRIALEKYAVSEAKLKLEIAKQYPDIVLSPGYTYEFGNKIWSLGLSSLLNFLTKNKLAIAEATQLREVEAAQFEALQIKVISEVNIASAAVSQSKQFLIQQQNLLWQQQQNTQRMQRKLTAGEIDRLELTYSKLENIAAEKNVVVAKFQLSTALNQLENTLQMPLNSRRSSINIEQTSLKN
jgi:outer membrane protein TolC